MKKIIAVLALAVTLLNCNTPRPATTPTTSDTTMASGTMGTTDTTRQMP